MLSAKTENEPSEKEPPPKRRWYRLIFKPLAYSVPVFSGFLLLIHQFADVEVPLTSVVIASFVVYGLMVFLLYKIILILKQKKFQYSLRSLLVVMFLFCILFAWGGYKIRQARIQKAAIYWVAVKGGGITYDYYYGDDSSRVNPPGPNWFHNLIGEDFSFNVVAVYLDNYPIGRNAGYPNGRRIKVTDITPLRDLVKLKELGLNDTQISNLAPLESLSDLEKLSLGGTQVSDITPLKGLSKLRVLSLSCTQVSDIKPLENLSNLEELGLSGTQVTNFTPLKGLINLKYLYLDKTKVNDLALLQGLKKLRVLYLGNTPISDLSPLKGLIDLEILYLGNTQVKDLSSLKGLTNLRELYLGNTQVKDLSSLKGLTNLRELYLENTLVKDLTPLDGLKNLKRLRLDSTPVEDLSPLKNLTSLGWLRLGDTQASKQEIRKLQQALPKYSWIYWDENPYPAISK